ncbi:MAG: DUF4880 domain-containing protein, partial [Asticcacaulis sp.]|nr:DUF4880 domain-containing protein [Asticcacaulis sp.]
MSTIDEEASDWVVRQASGPLDAASQLAFEAWYDTGSRQQGAYLRAHAIWRSLDKATVQADLRPEATRRSAKARAVHRPSRRALLAAGVATSAAAGLVAVVLGPRLAGGVTLRTTLGEVRKVPLEDRTIASLNSDSHLEVSMTPKLRRVVLVSGEALF